MVYTPLPSIPAGAKAGGVRAWGEAGSGASQNTVDTMYNMADLLTKCLSNTDFNRLVQLTQQNNDRAVRLVQFARAKVHDKPA